MWPAVCSGFAAYRFPSTMYFYDVYRLNGEGQRN